MMIARPMRPRNDLYHLKYEMVDRFRAALHDQRKKYTRTAIAGYLGHEVHWINDLTCLKASCRYDEAKYLVSIVGGDKVSDWFIPFDPYAGRRRGPKTRVRNYRVEEPVDEVRRLRDGTVSVTFSAADGCVHIAYGKNYIEARLAAEKRKKDIYSRLNGS